MVSLVDVDVRAQEGQRHLPLRADRRERLLHGAEHLHDLPEGAVAFVHDAGAQARRKLRANEDRAVVRDVLDDPKALDRATLRTQAA